MISLQFRNHCDLYIFFPVHDSFYDKKLAAERQVLSHIWEAASPAEIALYGMVHTHTSPWVHFTLYSTVYACVSWCFLSAKDTNYFTCSYFLCSCFSPLAAASLPQISACQTQSHPIFEVKNRIIFSYQEFQHIITLIVILLVLWSQSIFGFSFHLS